MNEILPFLKNSACWYVVFHDRSRQKLFPAQRDYEYYLRLLRKFKRIYQIHLFAFCLLPVNIQLIIQPRHPEQLLPFLENVHQAYALFFNTRYEPARELVLCQHKNVFIDNDQGLLDRIKYVECTTLGVFASKTLEGWSSCYHRVWDELKILDKQSISENSSTEQEPHEQF